MGFAGEYADIQAICKTTACDQPRAFTLQDRVNQAVAESERRLAAAQRADEILKKNPELEELLNLLQQF
jgi:hypothetical protein